MSKILIVEDEKNLAGMYEEVFSQESFEVFLAHDTEQAMKKTKDKNPDIILLDILLPGETGIAFLKRLREDEEFSNIPVVAFSNYEDEKTKEEALQLEAKEYLLKTEHTPQEIVEKVNQYLN